MIYTKFNYIHPQTESFVDVERNQCLPKDRVPSLFKIMQQFERGNGDMSIVRDLPFNELENNPYLLRGLDLADLPDLASETGEMLEDVKKKVDEAKLAKKSKETDVVDPESPS